MTQKVLTNDSGYVIATAIAVGAHAVNHQPGGSDAMAVDAAAATGSLRTIGTGALQACAGNDSRLTDSRTPTSHASTHAWDGTDALLPPSLYVKDDYISIGSGNVIAPSSTGLIWCDATVVVDQVLDQTADRVFWPASATQIWDEAYILESGVLGDLGANQNTLLWTDAARCPQTINTLLIIGI